MTEEELKKNLGTPTDPKGRHPNPFEKDQVEWERRKVTAKTRWNITNRIEALFEPRYITPPETSECIEALVTMTGAKQVLELGTHVGFTSLHILRALVGKPGARLTSVEAIPAHDAMFFELPSIAPHWRHIHGWTPQCLEQLKGEVFDLVFVDSDHSIEHTAKEMDTLWKITRPGSLFLFHDMPVWVNPDNRTKPAARQWLEDRVALGALRGWIFPTCEQLDCLAAWGPGYPPNCNPHLGIFIRGEVLA